MQTSGPRRYSRLDLCTTRQLESLSTEFCYDVETLRNIANALQGRTCRHSAHIKRAVDRQLKALTRGPPRPEEVRRSAVLWTGAAFGGAISLALVVDQVSGWLLHG